MINQNILVVQYIALVSKKVELTNAIFLFEYCLRHV